MPSMSSGSAAPIIWPGMDVAKRWSWERGYRPYIIRTRGSRYSQGKVYSFSEGSGPKRPSDVIEIVWNLLRTDEERRAATELVERLALLEQA